jgi:hypothetical protein
MNDFWTGVLTALTATTLSLAAYFAWSEMLLAVLTR